MASQIFFFFSFLSFSIFINVALSCFVFYYKIWNGPLGADGQDGDGWFGDHGRGDDGKVKRSDDTILSQLVKLQMVEGLPGADDGDVCRQKHSNMSSSIIQRVNLSSLKARQHSVLFNHSDVIMSLMILSMRGLSDIHALSDQTNPVRQGRLRIDGR